MPAWHLRSRQAKGGVLLRLPARAYADPALPVLRRQDRHSWPSLAVYLGRAGVPILQTSCSKPLESRAGTAKKRNGMKLAPQFKKLKIQIFAPAGGHPLHPRLWSNPIQSQMPLCHPATASTVAAPQTLPPCLCPMAPLPLPPPAKLRTDSGPAGNR